MSNQLGRVAFQRYLVHEHRSTTSSISAVAVDATGSKVLLGFTDGQLEEYRVSSTFGDAKLSLSARKHVGKKAVAAIKHMLAAKCLAVLCDEALLLLHVDTLEASKVAGLTAITAMAAEGHLGLPPLLAVATKPSRKAVCVSMYEVLAANGGQGMKHTALVSRQVNIPESGSIVAMAWVGDNVVLATGTQYLLLNPRTQIYGTICTISEDNLSPVMLLAVPAAQQALLLMNEVGVMTDSNGMPVGSALTFPSAPLALGHCGLFILAACDDGMHVYDRSSGDWVQTLDFGGPSVRPAPGQAVRVAGNAKNNMVVLAGYRRVWLFLPVALEDQAKQLLSRRKYGEALDLLTICCRTQGGTLAEGPAGNQEGPAPWPLVGQAQAALLLMQDLRFAEGLGVLTRVPTSVFQPCELFPLFPQYTAKWLDSPHTHLSAASGLRSSSAKPLLWALARPLQDVTSAIHATLLSRSRARQGAEGVDTEKLARQTERYSWEAAVAVAEYLWQKRTDQGLLLAEGAHTLLLLLLHHTGHTERLLAFANEPNLVDRAEVRMWLVPGAPAELQTGGHPPVGRYLAWAALCAQGPVQAPGLGVQGPLRPGQGEFSVDDALATWRALSQGLVHEKDLPDVCPGSPGGAATTHSALEAPPPNSGRIHSIVTHGSSEGAGMRITMPSSSASLSRLAAALAAASLTTPGPATARRAMEFLPWLLDVSPDLAIQVATGPAFPPAEGVLRLLRGTHPVSHMLFLQHLVTGPGAQVPAYHTELAFSLASLCKQAPAPAAAASNGGATCDASTPAQPGTLIRKAGVRQAGTPGAEERPSQEELRAMLQAHLEASSLLDCRAVLLQLQGSDLHQEQVVLHSKMGEHIAALRILALTMDDIDAAESYCREHAGQTGYAALLDMLLYPGPGKAPRLTQACHLLAAEGAQLDPLKVLDALQDDMPLSVSMTPVARMLRERLHRQRDGLIQRSLQRAMHLQLSVERAKLLSERVLMTDERVCQGCHSRLGTKMFAMFPNGLIMCFRCYQQQQQHPQVAGQ